MPDSVRRAIRTFFQAFLGAIITTGVLSTAATNGVVDWSSLKKAAVSALSAGIVATVSFVQNALEDKGTVPALLKAPASSGADPIPQA